MPKSAILRADGNSDMGLGHIYRLISIAEMIKVDYDLIFLLRTTSISEIIPEFITIAFIDDTISNTEEPSWIAKNYSPHDFFIIADGYDYGENYQYQLKDHGFNLIYIDDLAKDYVYADLLINHAPLISRNQYRSNKSTVFALGANYTMLRKPFLDAAKTNNAPRRGNNVFICFGGSDPLNLSLKWIKAINEFDEIREIHVVIGAAYNYEGLGILQKQFSSKIIIHQNLSGESLVEIVRECKFAIAPASTILYELCCCRLPIISGYYADNQKLFYRGFCDAEVIFPAGNLRDLSEFDRERLTRQFLDSDLEEKYIENQKRLIDGYSDNRLRGKINSINLSYRIAEENDIWLIYEWSNDTVTRKNSFNSELIDKENHQIWYKENLQNDGELLFIALVNDKPAGMVRYSIRKHKAIVGLIVDPRYRGQKLGSEFLRNTIQHLSCIKIKKVDAFIKSGNLASKKTFEAAGYRFFKETLIKDIETAVYRLEK